MLLTLKILAGFGIGGCFWLLALFLGAGSGLSLFLGVIFGLYTTIYI